MTRDHFDRDFAVLRGFNFDRSAFHTIPPFSNCWNEFSSRSHPQIGVLMQKANALEILQTRIAVDLSIPYHLFVKTQYSLKNIYKTYKFLCEIFCKTLFNIIGIVKASVANLFERDAIEMSFEDVWQKFLTWLLDMLPNVIGAALIFAGGWWLSNVVVRLIKRTDDTSPHRDWDRYILVFPGECSGEDYHQHYGPVAVGGSPSGQ